MINNQLEEMDDSSLVIHYPRHGYLAHSNRMLNIPHEIIRSQLNDYVDELFCKALVLGQCFSLLKF